MAKASGGIDLQAYNKASQEATNYLKFDSQTGLTIGQVNLNSKVNISGDGIKLYDEGGIVKTNISSEYSIFGDENSWHIDISSQNGMRIYGEPNGNTLYARFGTAVDIYGGDGNLHIDSDDMTFKRNNIDVTKFETHVNNITMPIVTTTASNQYPTAFYTASFTSPEYYGFVPSSVAYKATTGIGFIKIPSQDERKNEALFYTFEDGILKIYRASNTSTVSGTITIYISLFNAQYTARGVVGAFEDTTYNASMLKVANGTSDNDRSNAFNVLSDGDVRIKGDIYVGCNGDSTGGRKLVSASITTGNGTKSSVPSGASNLTNLDEVSLDEKGIYLLLGRVKFASNTSGRRGAAWASNPTGYFYHSLVVGAPANGGATLMQTMAIIEVTSNNAPYRAYLNCYHTAGASNPLDVEYYWRYIKLA